MPRSTRKTPAKPSQAPDTADQKDVEQPQQPDGVLVVKTTDEQGGLAFAVQTIGNVQITEVQTILEKGIQAYRNQVGLPAT